MVMAGILMHQGKLAIPQTFICAYAGSILGITLSYLLGRSAGNFFLNKYGKWFGMTQERQFKALLWFEKFGKWLLVVGYFIPGIRHFTGLSAGTARMPYAHFALFAYSGALLWATLFLTLGYYLGPYCITFIDELEVLDITFFVTALILMVASFFVIRARIKKSSRRK